MPCPAGLVPSAAASRCFAGFGAGTWSSLAFAAGLGLPVSVLRHQVGVVVPLPAWPGGVWESSAWGSLWVPARLSLQGQLWD